MKKYIFTLTSSFKGPFHGKCYLVIWWHVSKASHLLTCAQTLKKAVIARCLTSSPLTTGGRGESSGGKHQHEHLAHPIQLDNVLE